MCSEKKGANQLRFAVTAKLVCAFVFVYTDCWISHAKAHIVSFSGSAVSSGSDIGLRIEKSYYLQQKSP